MAEKKSTLLQKVYETIILVISMAGFVPRRVSFVRVLSMMVSVGLALYLSVYHSMNSGLAITYFLLSEFAYVGFIILVLSEHGLRNWFLQRYGNDDDAYTAYETVLGLLFFHNLISIGYAASSTPGDLFNLFLSVNKNIFIIPVAILFITGFGVKIMAAKAVSIDIYYLKDMFLGRKVSEFVVSGPYKYISNPMYGIGQLQAYATAIWYGSETGLFAALLNQCLVFTFYYLVERKFIRRVYLKQISP